MVLPQLRRTPGCLTYPQTVAEDWRVGPDDWAKAIAYTEGPQLLVAGPGTGKTEFLVRRAVHLIDHRWARPDQVLILAFSRRAAADLRRRVEAALDRTAARVDASTFHSFAYRLLETYGTHTLGWDRLPALLTGPEQVALVGDLLADEHPANWPSPFSQLLGTKAMAEALADHLLRLRERTEGGSQGLVGPAGPAMEDFLTKYDAELARRHRIDYGRLLVDAASIAAVERTALSDQYRYVLVDEYQDTSTAQAQLVDLITAGHRNITAAADPYQSVFSFRGAELGNVAAFMERFRGLHGAPPRRLVLTTSFRVPKEILDSALRITAGGRLPGEAGPLRPAPHRGRVDTYTFDQQSAEADWIAGEVQRLNIEESMAYRSMAVLVRSKRRFLPELSRALSRRRVPHQTPDVRLVDHPATRLVTDVVKVAVLEGMAHLGEGLGVGEEADRAMRRVLLGPLFELPLGEERELLRTRRKTGRPWTAVLADQLPASAELVDLLAHPAWSTERSAVEGFWHLWTTLPQFGRLVASPDHRDFRAAWTSLQQSLAQQALRDPELTLADFVALSEQEDFEATPLLSFRPPPADELTLTTLHQAKGLEFEVVFLANATEGSFPNLQRGGTLFEPLTAERRAFRLQEEMRLAYTAMTRASRRVVWTATDAGLDEAESRPSRFLIAAGSAPSLAQLRPPPGASPLPITPREAEAYLRRVLIDPAESAPRRLAAAEVLARPPSAALPDPTSLPMAVGRGPDTGVLSGPPVLSPSQAESYDQCPRRYVLERRLHVLDSAGPYAQFGSLIHTVLERAERHALDAMVPHADLVVAEQILDEVFGSADFGGPNLTAAWRKRGLRLIHSLYEDWPGGTAIPIALEHPLVYELDGLIWRGRADRVEMTTPGELRIVDYKTMASPPTQNDAAVSIQLAFYYMAAGADPSLAEFGQPTAAEFWFPLADRKKKTLAFQPARLAELGARLREIAGRIRNEDWTPRPGRHCGRCHFRLICPAWPESRQGFAA
jgi:superfamily I DNA/RNA helicase/RecB family exonuclease